MRISHPSLVFAESGKDYFGSSRSIRSMRRKRSSIEQALTKLYQLLEQYAPSWYTQEHREMAEIALGRSQAYPRAGQTGHGIHEFGDLRVDMRRIEVMLNGEPVCFAAREFQLLCYLIERFGTAIS